MKRYVCVVDYANVPRVSVWEGPAWHHEQLRWKRDVNLTCRYFRNAEAMREVLQVVDEIEPDRVHMHSFYVLTEDPHYRNQMTRTPFAFVTAKEFTAWGMLRMMDVQSKMLSDGVMFEQNQAKAFMETVKVTYE